MSELVLFPFLSRCINILPQRQTNDHPNESIGSQTTERIFMASKRYMIDVALLNYHPSPTHSSPNAFLADHKPFSSAITSHKWVQRALQGEEDGTPVNMLLTGMMKVVLDAKGVALKGGGVKRRIAPEIMKTIDRNEETSGTSQSSRLHPCRLSFLIRL